MAKIAIVLASDYEDSEFRRPFDAVRAAGHEVVVVGSEGGKKLEGKRGKDSVETDKGIADVSPDEFDALLVPGGHSPDKLRTDPKMVDFARSMMSAGKPVAAVCHGPQLLIEADVVRGRTMTSWPSVRTDLKNAGAEWVDQEVCVDGNLVTSRKPEDLEAFDRAFLEMVGR